MIIVFNILWAVISTLLFPIFVSDTTLGFSNSWFSIVFCVMLFCLLYRSAKIQFDTRRFCFTHILGFIFSMFTALGRALDVSGTVSFRHLVVPILVFSHIFAQALAIFWEILKDNEVSLENYNPKLKISIWIDDATKWLFKHPYCISIIMIVGWLPCFLADFPGGFRYDADGEVLQLQDGYRGDYPLLHSVIVTRLIPPIVKLTGSFNAGVAVYVILQMILLSILFTYILYVFNQKNKNHILIFCCILYYAFFPNIQILAVQELRDVTFSMLLTATIFLFYLMVSEPKQFFINIVHPIVLGLALVLTILSRNNNAGIVALVVVAIIAALVWIIYRKRSLVGVSSFAVTAIGGYILIGILLTKLCQPFSPGATGGALSIMSQPLARAYLTETESWTEEEVTEICKYMNVDWLEYWPENADSTKYRLTLEDDQFFDFLKFWLKIGMKHKGCYIDAMLHNTQNFWYPDSVIDGYNQEASADWDLYYNTDKSYFAICDNLQEPAKHIGLLPQVLDYYSKIGLFVSFEKIPILSMFFSIGFQFWIVLNCLFYSIYRKLNRQILPISLLLGYLLISSFVPLILLRYFSAVFFAVPMIVVFTLQPDKNNVER